MSLRAQKNLEEAFTLPKKDRRFLAEVLQESVDRPESQKQVDLAGRKAS